MFANNSQPRQTSMFLTVFLCFLRWIIQRLTSVLQNSARCNECVFAAHSFSSFEGHQGLTLAKVDKEA